MPRPDPFDGLSEFLAVARLGSFRKAAAALDVTPGAVSQAIQALEARLGLPLFHRTTRSVSLTEAGEHLMGRVGQAADTIVGSLDGLGQWRGTPAGTLRLLVHRGAVDHVLEPVLPVFHRAYPQVKLDIVVEERHAELVSAGYDAGIGIGEFIDRDMVAVRVTRPFAWIVAAAPAYLARHGRPDTPEDIARHACIRYRRPELGGVYRWEFERDGQSLSLEPPGSIAVNDSGLARALARQGMGLLYTSELHAADDLAAGTLVPVLGDFAPARDALFICFPRQSRAQPKLRAFVDTCTRVMLRPSTEAAG